MATGSSLGPESGTGQSGGPDVTWKKAGLLHLTSTFQRRDEAAWTPHTRLMLRKSNHHLLRALHPCRRYFLITFATCSLKQGS